MGGDTSALDGDMAIAADYSEDATITLHRSDLSKLLATRKLSTHHRLRLKATGIRHVLGEGV
jgi:hypothetical protein